MSDINHNAPQINSVEEESKLYYQYTGRLVSQALAEKARKGEYFGCAPTGYVNVRTQQETRVEIDLKLGPLVKGAFVMAVKART